MRTETWSSENSEKKNQVNITDLLMELNPENKEKVVLIIKNFYEGQQKVKEANPELLSIIEKIDITTPSPEDMETVEMIKTILNEKLGKDYYDLLYIYFLEIGKAMSETVKQEVVA